MQTAEPNGYHTTDQYGFEEKDYKCTYYLMSRFRVESHPDQSLE